MAINKNAILEALRVSIRGEFSDAFLQAKEKSFYEKVVTEVTSTSSANVYPFLSDFPEFRKWVGDRVVKNMKENSYSLRNESYESTLGVARTDIEDDNLGQYKLRSRLQAQAAIDFLNIEVAKLLKNGATTLCYDGQNFFDTDHPVNSKNDGSGTSATVSNIVGTGTKDAWYLLDLSKVLKPFLLQNRTTMEMESIEDTKNESVFMRDQYLYGIRYRGAFGYGLWQQAVMSKEDLTAENFELACVKMASFKRDGGNPMGLEPTALVVSPSLRSKAETLIKTATVDGTSNIHFNKVDIIVSGFLA